MSDELMRHLKAVDRGELTAEWVDRDGWVGNDTTYRLSNGWEIVVFYDFNSWDYVDRYRKPDGEWIALNVDDDAFEWCDPMDRLQNPFEKGDDQ